MPKSNIERGTYDHLNKEDPLKIGIDMDKLAKDIEAMNYGSVRFLAALIRARSSSKKTHTRQPDQLSIGIKNLLDQGFF